MTFQRAAAVTIALAVIATTAAAGCSDGSGGPTGTVTGRLVMAGGPAPGVTVRVPGTITASSASRTHQASAAQDGSFTLVLPAGSYTLTGTSPQYNDGHGRCVATAPVDVREGAVTRADITCVMR
jgi:hypothetical protein